MPRANRGPKPKKGTREYFVVVNGLPPIPMTEKPPKGIPFAAAKDLAAALSQQYGQAGFYTTEAVSQKKRVGGHREDYKWPHWRWRLLRTFRADWATAALQLNPQAPNWFGRVPQAPPRVPMASAGPPQLSFNPPGVGYTPRPPPKR